MDIETLFGVVKATRREESSVDVEKLLVEIEVLRDAALRYTRAVAEGHDVATSRHAVPDCRRRTTRVAETQRPRRS